MLCFVFISSSTLAITRSPNTTLPYSNVVNTRNPFLQKTFPALPILGVSTYFPTLSAQGVLAVDLDSGVPLYEKNSDAPLFPASTTKIITALVALDTYQLDSVLTVGKEINVDGQKMGLFVGEKMSVQDLLYGLLVYSANDAAETLAVNHPEGYGAFIAAMNAKAKALSMKNTYFDNPVGLDGNSQRSTARDLILASGVAMRNPQFARIVSTTEIVVNDETGKFSHYLKNLNKLLGAVPGVVGVKTGWTESARENLVTYVVRDNKRVMIALLGSQDRFGETKELIDWIYGNYEWQTVEVR